MKIYRSLAEVKDLHKPTAIAIGLFDGLHLGHQTVIQQAQDYAKAHDMLSGVITFQMNDHSIPKFGHIGRRINSESIFLGTLEKVGVEVVFHLTFAEFRDLAPKAFVENILVGKLDARFISCGQDFHFGKDAAGSWTDLEFYGKECGMEVAAVPLVLYGEEPISSTRIRQCIEDGNMPEANDMLGHRYAIDFEVVGGNRIGRTLGTPTINQPYPDGFIMPRFGVYATLTMVHGKWYTSVTSVGTKPTIGDYDALSETYIQGFEGDLYGEKVKVEFLQFIRKEVKFDSIEELRERILQDSVEAEVLGKLYLE